MMEALDKGAAPLKEFMLKQTRQADLALFVKLSRGPALQGRKTCRCAAGAGLRHQRTEDRLPDRLCHLHPFLIIDMVVASVLMSMGMMMMSPAIVSLPFKLMLFVLVDGWQLLIGSLAQSFY
jgi:flagellar biosynthetic protein FliP